MPQFRVAVVGLGVAGSVVAMLLARAGHMVTVFEQAAAVGAVGAGVLLQPSGQLALARLGLLEQVVTCGERIDRLYALTHCGHVLIDLPYAELGVGVCAYGVHRGDLFMVLHAAMVAAGATVVSGVRAVRHEKRAEGAALFDESGRDLGHFDFVIGCDGARSILRTNSGLPARVLEYPHGALWAIGKCERVQNQLWQVTHGTRRLCGLLPMGGGRCSLFWSLEERERERYFERGFAAWRDEVVALCPDAEEVFAGLTSFEQTRYTRYHHVRMARWFDERCVFLGDAAHAMSPHLGQGINLAMIDAIGFAQALEQAGSFAGACAEYTRMRRRHLGVYSWVTYGMSPFFQSRGRVKGWLRDLFLPWMPRVGPVRRQMLLTMSGLRAGTLGGRIGLP